ncbi:MAG TPA: hypothetical protein VGL71_02065 [Urbifossiella sp.]
MFTAITVAAALSFAPAQQETLQLSNVRITVGELGPTRKETKFLPGDLLFIAYDIDGLTIDPDGTAKYTMAMEVADGAGKLIFKQDPKEQFVFVPLRGGKLPGRTFITIGLDQPAGTYSCKTTVTDPKTKSTNSVSIKFEVLKPEFGIVGVRTSYDEAGGLSAPALGVVGQTIFVHFSIATFMRDEKTKQPNVELLFEAFDEKGAPTLGKPVKYIQDTGVKQEHGLFAMFFPLYMNRPGKFSVRVTATDKVSNKKATYDLPVTVLPVN